MSFFLLQAFLLIKTVWNDEQANWDGKKWNYSAYAKGKLTTTILEYTVCAKIISFTKWRDGNDSLFGFVGFFFRHFSFRSLSFS